MEVTRTTLETADGSKVITFDAVTKRIETNTAKVTKHPVEQGFVISDHVMVNNLKLSVDGVISIANNGPEPTLGTIAPPVFTPGLNPLNNSDPDQARADLRAIFNSRQSVVILTSEQQYPIAIDDGEFRLIMTSLAFDKIKPTRGLLSFKIKLEQIRVVSAGVGTLSPEVVEEAIKKAAQAEQEEQAKTLVEKNQSQLFLITETDAEKAAALAAAGEAKAKALTEVLMVLKANTAAAKPPGGS